VGSEAQERTCFRLTGDVVPAKEKPLNDGHRAPAALVGASDAMTDRAPGQHFPRA